VSTISGILIGILTSLIAYEISVHADRIGEWVIRLAAHGLRPEDRERYVARWLRELHDTPGVSRKLLVSCTACWPTIKRRDLTAIGTVIAGIGIGTSIWTNQEVSQVGTHFDPQSVPLPGVTSGVSEYSGIPASYNSGIPASAFPNFGSAADALYSIQPQESQLPTQLQELPLSTQLQQLPTDTQQLQLLPSIDYRSVKRSASGIISSNLRRNPTKARQNW
jgi:hypothetical protein